MKDAVLIIGGVLGGILTLLIMICFQLDHISHQMRDILIGLSGIGEEEEK